jgi:hypothetical protein
MHVVPYNCCNKSWWAWEMLYFILWKAISQLISWARCQCDNFIPRRLVWLLCGTALHFSFHSDIHQKPETLSQHCLLVSSATSFLLRWRKWGRQQKLKVWLESFCQPVLLTPKHITRTEAWRTPLTHNLQTFPSLSISPNVVILQHSLSPPPPPSCFYPLNNPVLSLWYTWQGVFERFEMGIGAGKRWRGNVCLIISIWLPIHSAQQHFHVFLSSLLQPSQAKETRVKERMDDSQFSSSSYADRARINIRAIDFWLFFFPPAGIR